MSRPLHLHPDKCKRIVHNMQVSGYIFLLIIDAFSLNTFTINISRLNLFRNTELTVGKEVG